MDIVTPDNRIVVPGIFSTTLSPGLSPVPDVAGWLRREHEAVSSNRTITGERINKVEFLWFIIRRCHFRVTEYIYSKQFDSHGIMPPVLLIGYIYPDIPVEIYLHGNPRVIVVIVTVISVNLIHSH